jgi:hypothetical protein
VNPAWDVGLLFRRYLAQLLRNPVWVIVGFSTPILYLALFTPLLRHLAGSGGLPTGNVLDLFLPGILSLLAFASGIGPGFSTIFELKAGVIERFRVTPASRFAILIGPILASMLMMLVFDAVVVAIAAGFGFSVHWAGLAVLAVLLGLRVLEQPLATRSYCAVSRNSRRTDGTARYLTGLLFSSRCTAPRRSSRRSASETAFRWVSETLPSSVRRAISDDVNHCRGFSSRNSMTRTLRSAAFAVSAAGSGAASPLALVASVASGAVSADSWPFAAAGSGAFSAKARSASSAASSFFSSAAIRSRWAMTSSRRRSSAR